MAQTDSPPPLPAHPCGWKMPPLVPGLRKPHNLTSHSLPRRSFVFFPSRDFLWPSIVGLQFPPGKGGYFGERPSSAFCSFEPLKAPLSPSLPSNDVILAPPGSLTLCPCPPVFCLPTSPGHPPPQLPSCLFTPCWAESGFWLPFSCLLFSFSGLTLVLWVLWASLVLKVLFFLGGGA